MNKENDNAVGRLGSTDYNESGGERMCSMPEEASGDEPGAHDDEAEVEGFLHSNATVVATLGTAFIGSFIVSILIARMWDEDEIKLHILNFLVNVLQSIARLTGGWAIECERTYNEYVQALH